MNPQHDLTHQLRAAHQRRLNHIARRSLARIIVTAIVATLAGIGAGSIAAAMHLPWPAAFALIIIWSLFVLRLLATR